MVMNKLQKGLINSCIALRASRLNCQKKFFKWEHIIFFSNSNRDFYSENNNVSHYTLTYQKYKKKLQKTLLSSILHLALIIGRISAQSHMLLFVICFSSPLNLVITFVMQCILIASRLVFVICFKS
jgi:hypothetical protein